MSWVFGSSIPVGGGGGGRPKVHFKFGGSLQAWLQAPPHQQRGRVTLGLSRLLPRGCVWG